MLVTELRLNGKTEDGLHLSLHDNDGNEFTVRVSDTLRATVNQQRLMSVPTTDEPSVSIKEVQRLLRAGQTAEQIARDNNISIEDIEIGFNSKFLLEMISNLDSEQVNLELSAPNRAGILIPQDNTKEGENILMLVMPVMLNQYV